MKYEKARAEVVLLSNEDVITASGCADKGSFTQGCEKPQQQSWCGQGSNKSADPAMMDPQWLD